MDFRLTPHENQADSRMHREKLITELRNYVGIYKIPKIFFRNINNKCFY